MPITSEISNLAFRYIRSYGSATAAVKIFTSSLTSNPLPLQCRNRIQIAQSGRYKCSGKLREAATTIALATAAGSHTTTPLPEIEAVPTNFSATGLVIPMTHLDFPSDIPPGAYILGVVIRNCSRQRSRPILQQECEVIFPLTDDDQIFKFNVSTILCRASTPLSTLTHHNAPPTQATEKIHHHRPTHSTAAPPTTPSISMPSQEIPTPATVPIAPRRPRNSVRSHRLLPNSNTSPTTPAPTTTPAVQLQAPPSLHPSSQEFIPSNIGLTRSEETLHPQPQHPPPQQTSSSPTTQFVVYGLNTLRAHSPIQILSIFHRFASDLLHISNAQDIQFLRRADRRFPKTGYAPDVVIFAATPTTRDAIFAAKKQYLHAGIKVSIDTHRSPV